MVARDDPDTEALVDRARAGDREAREQLLVRHRKRLRQMVALRMDRRLLARVDPSDVVQGALTDAAQELSDYLRSGCSQGAPPACLGTLAWALGRRSSGGGIMNASANSVSRSQETNAGLVEIVEEATNKLHAGEPVDVEAYVREHPELTEQLRRLLPALDVLAELGQSAVPGDAALTSSVPAHTSELGELVSYRLNRGQQL
jgi:hypothetical protein